MTWKCIVKFGGRSSALKCPCRAPTLSRTSVRLRGRPMRVSHHWLIKNSTARLVSTTFWVFISLQHTSFLKSRTCVRTVSFIICLNNCWSLPAKVGASVCMRLWRRVTLVCSLVYLTRVLIATLLSNRHRSAELDQPTLDIIKTQLWGFCSSTWGYSAACSPTNTNMFHKYLYGTNNKNKIYKQPCLIWSWFLYTQMFGSLCERLDSSWNKCDHGIKEDRNIDWFLMKTAFFVLRSIATIVHTLETLIKARERKGCRELYLFFIYFCCCHFMLLLEVKYWPTWL